MIAPIINKEAVMQDQTKLEAINPDEQSRFKPLDMEQWTRLVNQWDKAKENQQAYCQRLNLNINTFCYVRSKLKQKNKNINQFMPVTIQPASLFPESNHALMVENGKGLKLHIPLSMAENQLIHLLAVIGWKHA